MYRYFFLKTRSVETVKPKPKFFLGLVCFLILVLEVLLVSSDAQVFQKGDEVVVQNTLNDLLSVYENGPNNGKRKKIRDGTRGTFQGAKEVNEELWFKVDWGDVEGWSTLKQHGCNTIGTAAQADRRDKITAVLFRRISHEKTNHEYNGYGCNDNWDFYEGGHSGWDAQTQNVAGLATADEPFYSLTVGKVLFAKPGDLNSTAVIAIYNEACKKTTLYLHAREIDSSIMKGEDVGVGTLLGIQGNTGLWKSATPKQREEYKNKAESFSEHVHIEVQIGKAESPSRGAGDKARPTVDPMFYLYQWVTGAFKSRFLPWDVNHDGNVNELDWLSVLIRIVNEVELISRGLRPREYVPQYDVNSDGSVNGTDLEEIQEHFRDPPPGAPVISTSRWNDELLLRQGEAFIRGMSISTETLQQLLGITRKEDDGSIHFKRAIALLERLLSTRILGKTALLTNYPNPFNPETWIPYHLASDTYVVVIIYDATGVVVRRLEVGYQKAGFYTRQDRAVYWDGRTKTGERAASGIYFYTLTTDEDIIATRKMVVLK